MKKINLLSGVAAIAMFFSSAAFAADHAAEKKAEGHHCVVMNQEGKAFLLKDKKAKDVMVQSKEACDGINAITTKKDGLKAALSAAKPDANLVDVVEKLELDKETEALLVAAKAKLAPAAKEATKEEAHKEEADKEEAHKEEAKH